MNEEKNEEKLSIKDIVGLALKGWSKDDIKELFELAKTKEAPGEEGEQKTAEPIQTKAEPEPEPEPKQEEAKKEEVPDIDSLKNEIESLKSQLKEAQKENNSSDLSGKTDNKTDEEIINDMARSFM